MNRVFKTFFNRYKNCCVVISENSKRTCHLGGTDGNNTKSKRIHTFKSALFPFFTLYTQQGSGALNSRVKANTIKNFQRGYVH